LKWEVNDENKVRTHDFCFDTTTYSKSLSR